MPPLERSRDGRAATRYQQALAAVARPRDRRAHQPAPTAHRWAPGVRRPDSAAAHGLLDVAGAAALAAFLAALASIAAARRADVRRCLVAVGRGLVAAGGLRVGRIAHVNP